MDSWHDPTGSPWCMEQLPDHPQQHSEELHNSWEELLDSLEKSFAGAKDFFSTLPLPLFQQLSSDLQGVGVCLSLPLAFALALALNGPLQECQMLKQRSKNNLSICLSRKVGWGQRLWTAVRLENLIQLGVKKFDEHRQTLVAFSLFRERKVVWSARRNLMQIGSWAVNSGLHFSWWEDSATGSIATMSSKQGFFAVSLCLSLLCPCWGFAKKGWDHILHRTVAEKHDVSTSNLWRGKEESLRCKSKGGGMKRYMLGSGLEPSLGGCEVVVRVLD